MVPDHATSAPSTVVAEKENGPVRSGSVEKLSNRSMIGSAAVSKAGACTSSRKPHPRIGDLEFFHHDSGGLGIGVWFRLRLRRAEGLEHPLKVDLARLVPNGPYGRVGQLDLLEHVGAAKQRRYRLEVDNQVAEAKVRRLFRVADRKPTSDSRNV